jgi:hypothetical protein
MPKETSAESSEGGLVRLKYTFRLKERFDESDDDWLKCIEATSDELLGTYLNLAKGPLQLPKQNKLLQLCKALKSRL